MPRVSLKQKRAEERARLIAEAQEVEVASHYDIVVMGGGASGLVAAITAAEVGASVLVLEQDLACGRTILATGNGRCNFANTDLSPAYYNHPHFVERVMGDDPLTDILTFFSDCGMIWTEENGRLYPRSLSAASVRDVLLARAKRAGVCLAPARTVVSAEPHNSGTTTVGFEEVWEDGSRKYVEARATVAAFGGPIPQIEGAHITTTGMRPALCALRCQTQRLGSLDGRRARCRATVLREDEAIYEEDGEVLFRRLGLSGILTYNLSRYAMVGDVISLDLVPEIDTDELAVHLARFGTDSLSGIIDPVVAQTLVEVAEATGDASAHVIAQLVKAFTARVIGTMDEEHAQVIRGGLDVSVFDAKTLACTEIAGSFACGEALDVDGACGGYNLAWAWTSGMVAGRAATDFALAPEV